MMMFNRMVSFRPGLISRLVVAFSRLKTVSARQTFALLTIAAVFSVSCETLPPGEPPEGGIIPEPELQVSRLNGAAAVNHLLTAIAMRCAPISGAGKTPPLVSNRFVVSKDRVNYLPMEFWRKLINMKLIRPVNDNDAAAAYRLESEITRMNVGVACDSRAYAWEVKLRNMKTGRIVWRKFVKFAEAK